MKKYSILLIVLSIGVSGLAQKKKDLIRQVEMLKAQNTEMRKKWDSMQKAQEVDMADELHGFSYAMGVSIGSDLKESGVDSLSYTAFAAGMEDVLNGTAKMSAAEANKKMRATMERIEEERNSKLQAESASFLAENAKKPEITTTESGLQYEILTATEGAKPTTADKVKVHYTGMLPSGKVFDSSVERGEPIDFAVTGVIEGWTEALQLMSVGSKYKLYIPHDLAYGERGAGEGTIPPFAVLIFEVELLGIEGK